MNTEEVRRKLDDSELEEAAMMMQRLQRRCHEISVAHGFWEVEQDVRIKLMLIHSEVSEAFEALRRQRSSDSEPMSDHIPTMPAFNEELADIQIRLWDLAEAEGIDLGRTALEKMHYNESRPYLHGKRF